MPENRANFRHKAAGEFWSCYELLTPEIRKLADKNFVLLRNDPRHPSLQFKKTGRVWSVRVGSDHRALAVPITEGFLWFWIGPHAEYDRILKG